MQQPEVLYFFGGPRHGHTIGVNALATHGLVLSGAVTAGHLIREPADEAGGQPDDAWYRISDEVRYNDDGPVTVVRYVGADPMHDLT